MYRLLIEDDEGRTTIVPLIRNQINIGREEGNTIRLTERNVSRRHARLAIKDGQILIEDLQSYNGVWINGSRVEASVVVNPGDLLEIGDYHLSVQEETSDVERKARPSLPPDQDFDEQTPPLGLPPLKAGEDGKSALPSKLVVINTSLGGREYLLNKPEMTIGRTDDNDICIDHASVSRNHAKIVQQGDAYQLLDLGSANGIQVNGEEYGVCDLRWGDIVELGQVRLRFTSPDTPSETPLAVQETTAVPAPASRKASSAAAPAPRSNATLIIAVALFIALVGGAAWFLTSTSGDGDPKKSTKNIGFNPKKLPPPPGDELSTKKGQEKMLKLAEGAFFREDFREALQMVIKLLGVRSDWEQAIDLKRRIKKAEREYKLLKEAQGLKVEGDLIGAYKKFKQIPKDSRYTTKVQKNCAELLPKVTQALMDKATRAVNLKKLYEAKHHAEEILKLDPNHETAKAMLENLDEQIKKGVVPPLVRRAGSPLPPRAARRRFVIRRKARPRKRRRRRRKRPRRRVRKRRVAMRRTTPPPPRRDPAKPLGTDRKACGKIYKQKKYKTALKCYEKWLENHPKDLVVLVYLGSIASKIGNCSGRRRNLRYCYKSRRYYEKYLLFAPNGRFAPQIRKALKKQ